LKEREREREIKKERKKERKTGSQGEADRQTDMPKISSFNEAAPTSIQFFFIFLEI
jgi:hypothetical protein